ncbi:exodeoxyribonuclease V subunit gamma [Nocardioides salsibiostraticola]
MTLTLHRASRTDLLADAFGELLATPLPDPFAEEIVVVPAKGVERWLTQRLSHRLGVGERGGDGVCAGIRFLNPRSLVSLLLDRDRDDVWDPERLVWPLLATIDEHLDEPWCSTLATHLGHGLEGEEAILRRNRRYSVARRLAGLFSSYAAARPGVIGDWRQGRDTDGAGGELDQDLLWQAELWRALLARVDEEAPDLRHLRVVTGLRAGDPTVLDALDLPDRLSLFGHTRLTVTEVELLGALGEVREVHLWLPQPSPVLWDQLAGVGGVVPRATDDSSSLVVHPLLASLGRDTRELRRLLPQEAVETSRPVPVEETAPQTLLGWIQHDLRTNTLPDATARAARTVDPADRSLQVHACHGPARQIDVLREVLVGLLEDQPDLEPRDVLIMCPDVETFAPLISAGFGLAQVVADTEGGGHPAHRLRVLLADRALSSTNPLLAVAADLIELAGGRVTASAVLDLIASEPVRARFRFTDDDLGRMTGWVRAAGIRWGVDAEHRSAFLMDGFAHNTWRAGLDRILLGVALSGDHHRHLGRGLPLDDVASGDISLAGRLAELLDRLGVCLRATEAATTVEDWMEALSRGTHALTEVGGDDAWQVPQFDRELARAADSAEGGIELRLADVRSLLGGRLEGRPTRANFRTGTLTVATLVPMRSVPHRVICLVGLDDGVFPRVSTPDGDDVLARHPLTGERDPRSEDRQLLLDALLAATETVVITYTGANEQSGASRPPAVPLGEILDAADRTTAAPVRGQVLTRHPLQPYDARNLTAGVLVPEVPFSFDRSALAGAQAAATQAIPRQPFLTGALTPVQGRLAGDVSLADLKSFFTHPVRTFCRSRLEITAPLDPEEVLDAIPIDLDNLEKWGVGDRLLREVLAGEDPQAVMLAEQLRGTLPPGHLGVRALSEITHEVDRLMNATVGLREGRRRTLDVDVPLPDGRRVTGTVSDIFGDRLLTLGYSRLKPRQRLLAWIDLLALSAAEPDRSWTSHAVGRERAGPKRGLAGPLDHQAGVWLADLVALRDEGLRRPLPAPVATACAWAEAHLQESQGNDRSPAQAAARGWVTDRFNTFGITNEDDDAWHIQVYGADAPVSALEDAGLGEVAWRIWEPLLTHERVSPL